jgi:hypothetical protein
MNHDGFCDDLLAWITRSRSDGFISEAGASATSVCDWLDDLPQVLEGALIRAPEPALEDDFGWEVVMPLPLSD